MSGFYDEMILRMGLPIEQTIGVKITICDLCGMLVEGHGGILSYSPQQIVLRIKRKKFAVKGEELYLLEVTKDEVFIKGKILSCGVEHV